MCIRDSAAALVACGDSGNNVTDGGSDSASSGDSTGTTNTVTMPPGQHTVSVAYAPNSTATGRAYLPSVVHVPLTCMSSIFEIDPNNEEQEATGFLCPDREYTGWPDDRRDFFSFVAAAGDIAIELQNHVGTDIQLQLHHEWIGNLRGYSGTNQNGYYINEKNLPAGLYYIVIVNPNPPSGTAYRLRATFLMAR